jgi:GT2 family glycosyltransferase
VAAAAGPAPADGGGDACDPNRRRRPGRRDGAATRRDGQHSRDLQWRKSVNNSPSVPGLVSVVVVGHNNWPELEMAIASALGQTYFNLEVVVVDNDSADATSVEVPRRFGQRVRYVRQPNSGDGGGYNRGIAESTGEFVHLLDGDDVLSPTMIEKQVTMLDRDKSIDAVYGDVRPFLDEPGVAPWPGWEKFLLRDYDDLLAALIRADDNGYMIPSSILFRRSTLERLGPFIAREGPWDDIWWQVDREYLLRAANAGCRFRHSPGALLFHRQHRKQMTQDIQGMARGYEVLLERAEQMITREPYHGMLRSIRARRLFGRAMSVASGRTKALGELRRARMSDSQTITPLRYALGLMVILVPGGVLAYRLQRHLRRLQGSAFTVGARGS